MCYWEENISKQIEIPSLLMVFLSTPFNKVTLLKSLLRCYPWLLQSLRPSDQDHQILINLDFVLTDNFFLKHIYLFLKSSYNFWEGHKSQKGRFLQFYMAFSENLTLIRFKCFTIFSYASTVIFVCVKISTFFKLFLDHFDITVWCNLAFANCFFMLIFNLFYIRQ